MSRNSLVTPVERSIKSTMQVKNRKRKGVATSEDQQDSESHPRFFVWKRNNKFGNPASRNVYKIPQKVISECLQSGLRRIQIVDSDGGERYEEESSKDPSKDGDLKNLSNYCVWKKEVDDPEVVEKNILKIPQHVINTYSLIPISRIQLVDCDHGDKYDCELHTTRRANSVEKYI
ncbi:unnamed protein product [Vicia faba]|uniref:Uncharacterized protein n=1 Tax=Vicia faba TaxID=3906 RepID=A0AAV1ASK9_VICFA|nr:unnamed protein product [Vicia faba]